MPNPYYRNKRFLAKGAEKRKEKLKNDFEILKTFAPFAVFARNFQWVSRKGRRERKENLKNDFEILKTFAPFAVFARNFQWVSHKGRRETQRKAILTAVIICASCKTPKT
ncbi:MAG: hypothetical protein BWK80_01625 [Desulfobacteraceae bacterium IS3]|nr:MAG: hypothetical protein BWK80_01625 [Desulfobacteraceae bacterium IS3]